MPQLPPATPPHCSRNAGCEGAPARLAATQLGVLPPPIHPHFLAEPGVSNSRPHKFQAQPQQWRKQRTFSQPGVEGRAMSGTSLVSSYRGKRAGLG